MKKIIALSLTLLLTTLAFGQKKERIKGSKVVTIESKTIENFDQIEVEDNIEVYLVKGDNSAIEIEADENLHELIQFELAGSTLHLSTSKTVTSYKKLIVKVTYTDSFKMITAKNDASIYTLSDLELEQVTVKNLDFSKSYLNVKSPNFTLIADDKSKIELNLKAETSTIELSKNAQLKALIASASIKFDMYQKSTAIVEGDVPDAKLRLDNNANFAGKNFVTTRLELTTEAYTYCSIFVNELVTMDASGKSEIQLFGAPKIEMKNFADSAILYKKQK
ncbi:GIN domain-containing protein [Flavobacterium sp. '19STA2R22 D10 B1']|uniref:GIN domain-containing protein n=1 Tax=Flavobacterium aerium TaxID=3037261 RepID=UPI00278C7B8A|nr:DUF2807 domain-containing protein [Flavobacterium sp. '19STA2R22 D10 B1']